MKGWREVDAKEAYALWTVVGANIWVTTKESRNAPAPVTDFWLKENGHNPNAWEPDSRLEERLWVREEP